MTLREIFEKHRGRLFIAACLLLYAVPDDSLSLNRLSGILYGAAALWWIIGADHASTGDASRD
jgi:hypothetical protein